MEEVQKKYLYAEKAAQRTRANQFLTSSFLVFYVFMLGIVWIAAARGIRSLQMALFFTAIGVIMIALTLIMYRRNPADAKIKYISLAGLMIVTFVVGMAFDSYYVRFMSVVPMVCSVLFFNVRFAVISGLLMSAMNIVLNVVKVQVMHAYQGEAVIDQLCATATICMMLLLIYFVTRVADKFNHDTRHSLMREQERQKQIMDSVLAVAEKIRLGTENAVQIVDELDASTENVNGAMRDISDSTLNTAENIQTQTTMTQNIQDSIEQLLDTSQNMVQMASQSGDLNEQSLQIMNQLKMQSEVISETNSEVAQAMKKLQDCANAVKSIIDTIVSISSQTNLLALNASIESARAGEAGRGFAVVADEIRQLAEKTREETQNIEEILNELTENAAAADGAVNKSVAAAGKQEQMISEASESIGVMSGNVNGLVNSIDEIDRMLNSLSEANNQIVDNIMQLSATTEEVTASSSQASELSVRNLDNAEEAKKLLGNVLDVSHELDQYIL